MRLFVRCVATSAVLVTSFLACNSDRSSFGEAPPSLVDGHDAAPPPPSCEGRRCSRDLHAVIDACTDQVIETCRADQGCGDGKCTTPCEAASQSQGSIGCSFWTIPPDTTRERGSDSSCFAAFVANTWSTPVSVKASYGADSLDISKSVYRAVSTGTDVQYERIEGPIPPGEVGVIFLADPDPATNQKGPDSIACPAGVTVAYRDSPIRDHTTSIYKAFHLETDVPISAYSIFPYGGAKSYVPSATLLLPTTSWGTNYMMIDGRDELYNVGLPFVQIVAQEDDTVVRINPRVDIREGEGVAAGPQGNVSEWTLQRGQVLEFMQTLSLGGSPLESNHPVAIFGGTQCSFIPLADFACDSLHQQIPPIKQWSSSYSAVPYKTRRVPLQGQSPLPEVVTWRIGAAREGTILTFDPEPAGGGHGGIASEGPPAGAPHMLAGGQLVFFESDRPFRVHSQGPDYPIYLANYMTGGAHYQTDGDPDYVNVVPDEQFLDSYVFFVDHTYRNSNLTFVRQKNASGFHDVNLDCTGPIQAWQPLGTDGTIEYAWVDITRDGQPSGACTYGRHQASSDGPFALYVWGTDRAASYGFPAGAGSRPTSSYRIEVH